MSQVVEKPRVSPLIGNLEVAPVGATANVPALRAEGLVTATPSVLETYRHLTARFAHATRDVGYSGAPIVAPSAWLYFGRTAATTTAGCAAVALGASALADAFATGISFSFVPAALAGGVAFLATALHGWRSASLGLYTRRRTEYAERVRDARAQQPLDPAGLAFVKERFDASPMAERALIASMAKEWLRELDVRQVIGKNARDLLRDIVACGATLPAALTASADRVTAVARTVYRQDGEPVQGLAIDSARLILRASDLLEADEHAILAPQLRNVLFDGEKPRSAMQFNACQAVLEGLAPRKQAG